MQNSIIHIAGIEQSLVNTILNAAFINAQAGGCICLGVNINQEHALPVMGQVGTEIDGGGGFSHTAFLV